MSAVLSLLLGLAFVAFPLATLGSAAAGLFGIALGLVACGAGAAGRWWQLARAGMALSALTLIVAAVLLAVAWD
jgi:hypothetical protein